MLVGLGFLSAVAANWLDMPRAFRAALIVLCYLFSILAAWRVEAEFPRTSRALLLLGSFIYGGGIFLMAQMFHQGGHWTTALAWWIAGVAPAVLVFRDPLQLILLQSVALVYLYGACLQGWWGNVFTTVWRPSSVGLPWSFFWPPQSFLIVCVAWLGWRRMGEFRRLCFGMNVLLTLSFVGLHLFAHLSDIPLFLLLMCSMGILMALCSRGAWKDELTGWGIRLAGICGLFLTVPELWHGSFVLGWFPGLSAVFASPETALAVLSALIFSLLMLGLACRGHASAVAFFCFLVLRYYFDRFYDFMPKAAFFTVGGLMLIGMGVLMERMRRRGKRNRESVEGGERR